MVCQGCGCVFCPEPPDQYGDGQISRYCRPSCQRLSRKRRARARGGRPSEHRRKKRNRFRRMTCPGKIRYETAEDADTAAALLWRRGVKQWPYECLCGGWHLSSIDPALAISLGRLL